MASGTTRYAPHSDRVKLVVASSVMLTFISFWRAAAVVLNDLGSSAFYAGGIAEQAVGKSAAWFILGVMLFSYAVRSVYVESSSMFTRGGVYRVVKEALGGSFAKISVSALMFDYVLTGPISGVSAGQYITGLLDELLDVGAAHGMLPAWMMHGVHTAAHLPVDGTSAVFAAVVTMYYWWQNTKGIEESTDKALSVMQVTTVMVVILLGWGWITAFHIRAKLPPLPFPSNLHFAPDALGFLKGTRIANMLGVFGILMAFGHSVLAMSGEETLAQVNREIEHPKLKNLRRAAIVIAIYTFLFTGVGTMLASMIIPDAVRVPVYRDNLIAGMAMYMWGPLTIRIIFQVFVVIVGFLILSGAVNTSMIGSTGVMMRLAEDGVLTDWFRKPHHRFGTSYRIVNLITGLQLAVILISRGNVIMLGEAYAFGVIWSFTFNALAMLVLRWKFKVERGKKVPINISIGKTEIPVGLFCVFLTLAMIAVVNLVTKSVATESGFAFTATFFAIFAVSERRNAKKHALAQEQMKEHFQLEQQETIGRETLQVRPGGVLVTMRDPVNPYALKWALARTNTDQQDIVVLTARMMGAGGPEVLDEQIFSEHEQMLFTKAVSVAESFGKHISLLVVPAGDIFAALVQAANSLEVAALIAGLSTRMSAQEQAYHIGQAWENLPEPKRQFTFYVVMPDGSSEAFHIGPHAPSLRAEDVQLVHRLWLNFRRDPEMQGLHHSDIVTYALTRMAMDYARDKQETMRDLRRFTQDSGRDSRLGITSRGSDRQDRAMPAPRPSREEDQP
jgi:amino acid transporter